MVISTEKYNKHMTTDHFWGFNLYIFAALVKHGALILVSEMQCIEMTAIIIIIKWTHTQTETERRRTTPNVAYLS